MSIRIMTNVWEHQGISPTQKLVLLALADWANDEGLCWPSIERLCGKSSLSRRAVQSAIKTLCEMGLLIQEQSSGRGCRYWLKVGVQEMHGCSKNPTVVQEMHTRGAGDAPNTSYTHQLNTTSNKSSDDDPPVTEDEIIECWNDLASRTGLPKIKVMNDKRRNMLRKRIKECPDVATWSLAFRNIERSSFLRGDNERGWQADFDFLIQPTSFMRIIEGSYTYE